MKSKKTFVLFIFCIAFSSANSQEAIKRPKDFRGLSESEVIFSCQAHAMKGVNVYLNQVKTKPENLRMKMELKNKIALETIFIARSEDISDERAEIALKILGDGFFDVPSDFVGYCGIIAKNIVKDLDQSELVAVKNLIDKDYFNKLKSIGVEE